ncbi:hypothetical protein DFP72DRAFT_533026 [Ephemerocybe angulata]|uniref:Uncharacterized protein n=1 Tax=Ephemerocybe angulata TaxID=980116 RepID=A0A8H6HQ92_9AGAR|nr:hypothetical protein DFP72DRAFT_533026 [Tulosesus angulatus]
MTSPISLPYTQSSFYNLNQSHTSQHRSSYDEQRFQQSRISDSSLSECSSSRSRASDIPISRLYAYAKTPYPFNNHSKIPFPSLPLISPAPRAAPSADKSFATWEHVSSYGAHDVGGCADDNASGHSYGYQYRNSGSISSSNSEKGSCSGVDSSSTVSSEVSTLASGVYNPPPQTSNSFIPATTAPPKKPRFLFTCAACRKDHKTECVHDSEGIWEDGTDWFFGYRYRGEKGGPRRYYRSNSVFFEDGGLLLLNNQGDADEQTDSDEREDEREDESTASGSRTPTPSRWASGGSTPRAGSYYAPTAEGPSSPTPTTKCPYPSRVADSIPSCAEGEDKGHSKDEEDDTDDNDEAAAYYATVSHWKLTRLPTAMPSTVYCPPRPQSTVLPSKGAFHLLCREKRQSKPPTLVFTPAIYLDPSPGPQLSCISKAKESKARKRSYRRAKRYGGKGRTAREAKRPSDSGDAAKSRYLSTGVRKSQEIFLAGTQKEHELIRSLPLQDAALVWKGDGQDNSIPRALVPPIDSSEEVVPWDVEPVAVNVERALAALIQGVSTQEDDFVGSDRVHETPVDETILRGDVAGPDPTPELQGKRLSKIRTFFKKVPFSLRRISGQEGCEQPSLD